VTVTVVLGAHRSGTSLVARCLQAAGLDLGPPGCLMPPGPGNPEGFFEHLDVVAVNDELLARHGGSALDPPVFPEGWAAASDLEDLRARARDILARDFHGRSGWGVKDPRLCFTLPFWQSLLPPFQVVLCVRSPHAVARSLAARDGMTADASSALWLRSYLRALGDGADRETVVVFPQDLVVDAEAPEALVRSVLSTASPAESGATVRRTLWHHADGGPSAVLPAVMETALRLAAPGPRRLEPGPRRLLADLARRVDAEWAARLALEGRASSLEGSLRREEAGHAAARTEAAAWTERAQRAERSLEVALGSRSWRSTAPLRRLASRLRRRQRT
jgi:hypothetical protein